MSGDRAWAEPSQDRGVQRLGVDNFELASDDEGRVACILCRGALRSCAVDRLRSGIDAALARPRLLLCLDLEEVTFVDSRGVSVLKGAIERCASQRVHLELWPGPAVERMLRMEAVSVPLRAYPARPAKLFDGADWP